MTRMIEFTKPMRPHGVGDRRVVSDDIADRLVAEGSAKIVVSVFDRSREPGDGYKTRVPTYHKRTKS